MRIFILIAACGILFVASGCGAENCRFVDFDSLVISPIAGDDIGIMQDERSFETYEAELYCRIVEFGKMDCVVRKSSRGGEGAARKISDFLSKFRASGRGRGESLVGRCTRVVVRASAGSITLRGG